MTLDALAAEIASQAKAEAKSIIDAAKAEAKRKEEEAREDAKRRESIKASVKKAGMLLKKGQVMKTMK